MATNAKENSAIKGRQTKLSKKSHEELIAIVLKKDRVERNLTRQIGNLKAEVNHLVFRVENFDRDMAGVNKQRNILIDKNKTLNEQLNAIRMEKEDTDKMNKTYHNLLEVKEKEIHNLYRLLGFSGTLLLGACICFIFC
ncbi:MAG: hypothetical protein IJG68_01675 [Bacilli bacterium]|nr:hypothetical protein [Bacilli bacterium]